MNTFFRCWENRIPILIAFAASLGVVAFPDDATSQTIGVCLVPAVLAAGDEDAGDQSADDPDAGPEFSRGMTSVDPKAKQILRAMGDYLAADDEFALVVDVTRDTLMPDGQMVQFGGVSNIAVRRPDRLHAEYRGDERMTTAVCTGEQFFALNLKSNTYTVLDVPPKLDDAIDLVVEEYDLNVPLADFLYENPYDVLIENVDSGYVLGRHAVDGHMCHHLVFKQQAIDWQVWIEDGPHPVPRKFIINYKGEDGSPQYTARFLSWDFEPRLAENYFKFEPPAGADLIDFLRVEEIEVEE